MNKHKIGISPLLWSNDDFTDIGQSLSLKQSLSEMYEAGYEGCEIGSKYPSDTSKLKALAAEYQLSFCNQWFSLYLLTKNIEQVENDLRVHLDKLKALNANVVGVAELSYNSYSNSKSAPFNKKPYLLDYMSWEQFGALLNHLGDIAKNEYGIKLCYHHHLGTVVHTADEIKQLMSNTNPVLVYLNYDCGHLLMACEDPIKIWQQYVDRIGHVHLKNVVKGIRDLCISDNWSFKTAILNGIFTIPGDDNGMLQSEELLLLIKHSSYQGWLVIEAELNPLNVDPLTEATKAYRYVSLQLTGSIDYLCIGHACHDVKDEGYKLGGTVSYSSLLAQEFGRRVGVMTSYGPDFLFCDHFRSNGIELFNKSARETTVFENTYGPNGRTQYLRAVASKLTDADKPEELDQVAVVHFGPIANEIDFDLLKQFPNSLKVATIQGWLRNRKTDGLIVPQSIDWSLLSPLDIVIFSEEDVQGLGTVIDQITQYVAIVIVTRGASGVDAYRNNQKESYLAYPTEEIDPTGAGDVFSTAFIIKYDENHNLEESIGFGQAASSLIVERQGTHPIPTLLEINHRLEKFKY